MSAHGVAGLVLGAGASTRMGPETNKLTEIVGGKPLITWPIDAFVGAGIDPVFVVTGHDDRAVRRVIDETIETTCQFIHHPGWQEGMGSSIAWGVRALLQQCAPKALLISVGDLPGLRPEWVIPLIVAFERADSAHCICVPTHRGRAGHPVLFGAHHWPALAGLTGDRGARSIIDAQPEQVCRVEIESPAILLDVDTPADLEEWARHEG